MTSNAKKAKVLCLSRNPGQCTLHVSGNMRQQVENFKYIGVVFTSDGTGRSMHELVKTNAVLREVTGLWSRNGTFTSQNC